MTQTEKAKGGKAKKLVIRYCLIVLIALIVGFGIYQWNATTLTNDQLPMPLGFAVSVVKSGSMEPELSVHDVIVVCPQDSYEVGDVVVYQSKTSLVVHRIIQITDDNMFITQGDANNTPDEAPISIDNIKGEVTFSIPLLGLIVRFFQSAFGTLLLLALAVWLYIRSLLNEKAEKQKKMEEIRQEIEQLKHD